MKATPWNAVHESMLSSFVGGKVGISEIQGRRSRDLDRRLIIGIFRACGGRSSSAKYHRRLGVWKEA